MYTCSHVYVCDCEGPGQVVPTEGNILLSESSSNIPKVSGPEQRGWYIDFNLCFSPFWVRLSSFGMHV